MRIEIKGRKVAVSEDLRKRIEKRFEKISRQVSPLAELEVELSEERNPRVADSQVAEATLHVKGTTLRCTAKASSMVTAVNEVADDLARQVKKHRDKKRDHRRVPASSTDVAATS
jgi:ribosome hibernation promoting factor